MKKLLVAVTAFGLPSVAFAQGDRLGNNIGNLLRDFQGILDLVVPILIGVAVVVFLWGVVKFIANAGDEEARKEARGTMIWGIIGIVVMVSIWGLVAFVQRAFDLEGQTDDVGTPELPR